LASTTASFSVAAGLPDGAASSADAILFLGVTTVRYEMLRKTLAVLGWDVFRETALMRLARRVSIGVESSE
jgi:hypothetical protein